MLSPDPHAETPGVARYGAMNGGRWNYDRDAVSRGTAIAFPPEEDMTQQQFKEESDINTIVRRFGLTGQMPENLNFPVSGDFCDIVDFQTAMNAVVAAEESFMTIPAEVRAKFDNDPQKLMMFLANEGNRSEAVKLGLVKPAPERTRDVVQAVDELKAHFERTSEVKK